jgi:predicted ribosomally synthesized peptide with nif11-like leader
MATVKEMITKVQQDASLREALEAATDQDGRIAAFRAAGLDVTAQDLANAETSAQQDELSDADLEGVAGGATDQLAGGAFRVVT